MSTTRQQLDHFNRLRYTFEEIEARFEAMDSVWKDSDAALVTPTAEQMHRNLVLLWSAVQPILTIVAGLPLLPPAWSDALKLFITILAQLLSSTAKTGFKAGKDL